MEGSTQTFVKPKYVEGEVEIPSDVKVELKSPTEVVVKGKLGTLSKRFINSGVELSLEDKKIRVRVHRRGRKGVAMLGTVIAHFRNMFTGVTKGYTYKLKVVASHFPMSVKVSGDSVLVENFLGERVPRKVKIPEGVKVTVKGVDVIVSGIDKEKVGNMAASLEQVTRIKGLDPRKFLDGIYVYAKEVGLES